MTLNDITTERRADDWIAFAGAARARWDSGRTEAEAIGALVITLRTAGEVGLFDTLSDEQRQALTDMVEGWASEGFTEPPYPEACYDIFEALRLERVGCYDLRRGR